MTRFHFESVQLASKSLDKLEASVDGVLMVNWVNLYSGLKRDGIEKAPSFTASEIEDSLEKIITPPHLFDEICLLLFVFYC